jgi:hypothetical protein
VTVVEGNAESVPKIRITEKHFAGVAKAKSAEVGIRLTHQTTIDCGLGARLEDMSHLL